nr:hypothetical protein [uncultured Kingella sp.]
MNINQNVADRHTPQSRAALQAMFACLDSKKPLLPETENQVWTVRRVAADTAQDIPEQVLSKLLLDSDQCNDLKLLQDLCKVIAKAAMQINVVRANHDLRLPPLYLAELTDYLLRIDVLITASKTAARRLGVEAVQPKVNTEYLYRVLQKDKLNSRVEKLQAA